MHSYVNATVSRAKQGICVQCPCGGVTGDEAVASYTCVYTHTTDTSSYKDNFFQNPSPIIIVTKSKEKKERQERASNYSTTKLMLLYMYTVCHV